MINATIPEMKMGAYDPKTGMIPVVFTLIDNQGESFNFERDVNAAIDINGNLDTNTTSQRCYQVLSGLIHNCQIGMLSKAKQDERAAEEAKSAEVAKKLEADHQKRAADDKARAEALEKGQLLLAKQQAEAAKVKAALSAKAADGVGN